MPFRAATLRWVDRLIIGQNLCPYTHAVRKRAGALRVGLSAAADAETLLTELDACCDRLAGSNNGAGETALLVLPPTPGLLGERLMDEFLAFLSLGWQLVDRVEKRDPAVQLALFHPRAVRNLYGAEAGEEDAADFAMRAPYPTVHVLRTSDVQAVNPESAAAVPERNRRRLRELGVPWLRGALADIATVRGRVPSTQTKW